MILLAFAENSIQLVPDGTLLFHLALVILMVVVLNATLLKPINRVLQERDRRTKGRLAEARATMDTVTEKMRTYESRLRQTRAEGYALMERERAALSAEREGQLVNLRNELGDWMSKEKEKVQTQADEVRASLARSAAERAREITRQVLQ